VPASLHHLRARRARAAHGGQEGRRAREPFNREKILRSLRIACNKRPISADALEETAESLERELAEGGEKEVPSRVIGERVMERLKHLDGVAYVRFASVYKSFRDIDEFMQEMDKLIRSPGGGER
jgi:transcriptional repressor NrdR